jgi:histone acetyltransferase (RNA polymerase elongator complex component)
VIVLGGTWHSYPKKYRRMFITLLYYAFNTVHEDRGRDVGSMEEEIKLNETSKCRVIGLTIETRPDQITPQALIELREMGMTRVQLGIQHTDDRILYRIRRGCTDKDSIIAIKSLKDSGFKVDIHIMPDLPKPFKIEFEKKAKKQRYSNDFKYTKDDIDQVYDSVGSDLVMFEKVFHSEDYYPDQVKIYPCEVMDWTKIKKDFEDGSYVPYGTIIPDQKTNDLIELLIQVKSSDFPEEIRINRLIRDIPEGYILGGIKDTSGRQRIEKMMKERGLRCRCIRCREIKKKRVKLSETKLRITHYIASEGDEYFLQYVTGNDEIVGFLRLRVSKDSGLFVTYKKDGSIKERLTVFDELVNTAMIRELHVYGEAVKVNRNTSVFGSLGESLDSANTKTNTKIDRTQQHIGFGSRLLQNAFHLAKSLGYSKISVIPGDGVKPYYRRAGFCDGKYFLFKDLDFNEVKSEVKAEFTMDEIIHKIHRFGTLKQLKITDKSRNIKHRIKNTGIIVVTAVIILFIIFRMC